MLDDPRLTAVGLLEEARAGLQDLFSEQLAEHSLSPLEFEVLLRLSRSADHRLRMADLAAQVLMSASGLTRVVDRLEAADLVTRGSCAEDRRGTWAILTDEGLSRLLVALPGHLEVIERWYTGVLHPDQLVTLLESMRIVRDLVRPGATAGACASPEPVDPVGPDVR